MHTLCNNFDNLKIDQIRQYFLLNIVDYKELIVLFQKPVAYTFKIVWCFFMYFF